MSFTALVERIQGFVDFFKPAPDKPYPETFDIINKYDKKNWNKVIPQAYSFNVVDLRNPSDSIKGFNKFNLQINPQDMMQDENFAINITPTQNGIVSEHNGIVLRDLVISGTTGIHPLRGVGGVNKDGSGIGISKKFRSGYEEFNQLRNYFRAYSEYKRKPINFEERPIMVFINRKDLEKLIVEPVKFTMKRQGARGFLYDYQIVLKVLGNLNQEKDPANNSFFGKLDNVIETVNDYMNTGVGLLLEGSDLLGQVEREVNNALFEPLRQADLAIKTISGIGNQIWHMGDDFIGKMNSSQTLAFFQSILDGGEIDPSLLPANLNVAAAAGGSALLGLGASTLHNVSLDESLLSDEQTSDFENQRISAVLLPRSFFEGLRDTAERIGDNATESFGLGDSTYNTYAHRTSTFTPSPTKQTTNRELDILYGFMLIQRALNLLLSFGGDIAPIDLNARLNSIEENFNNQIDIPLPPSVTEITIPYNATLEQLAFQYLKDYSRWIELVQLNNLIPPYITNVSTNPRIKKYGDRILLPGTRGQTDTNIRVVKESIYTKNLTETEKRLGIDLKVNETSYDFLFGNNSDFTLAVGPENIKQSVNLKLRYERGDLKLHPEIGLGLVVGDKVTSNLSDILDNITDTILQDPRINRINDFRLSVNGNSIFLGLNLNVAESETPVPLNIAL